MTEMFHEDLGHSNQITLEAWLKRPFIESEGVLRLFRRRLCASRSRRLPPPAVAEDSLRSISLSPICRLLGVVQKTGMSYEENVLCAINLSRSASAVLNGMYAPGSGEPYCPVCRPKPKESKEQPHNRRTAGTVKSSQTIAPLMAFMSAKYFRFVPFGLQYRKSRMVH
jgi:hypothetical protein